MKHFKATRLSDNEVCYLTAQDDQSAPPGYSEAEWSFELMSVAPTELDSAKGALKTTANAEEWALQKVEEQAEKVNEQTIRKVRRQIAIDRLWNELQRLKLAQATGNIPTDTTERRKMFPTLMALSLLKGRTLNSVATAVEARLWDRVRKTALYEAKLLIAHDNIKAATTIDDKIAASQNITWDE